MSTTLRKRDDVVKRKVFGYTTAKAMVIEFIQVSLIFYCKSTWGLFSAGAAASPFCPHLVRILGSPLTIIALTPFTILDTMILEDFGMFGTILAHVVKAFLTMLNIILTIVNPSLFTMGDVIFAPTGQNFLPVFSIIVTALSIALVSMLLMILAIIGSKFLTVLTLVFMTKSKITFFASRAQTISS